MLLYYFISITFNLGPLSFLHIPFCCMHEGKVECLNEDYQFSLSHFSVFSPYIHFSFSVLSLPSFLPLRFYISHVLNQPRPQTLNDSRKKKKRRYILQGKSITQVKEVTRTIREWLHLQNFSNLTFITAK